MDRLRMEAEFFGPRRIDELRRQAHLQRMTPVAGPPFAPVAAVAAHLAFLVAGGGAGRRSRPANDTYVAARHAGG